MRRKQPCFQRQIKRHNTKTPVLQRSRLPLECCTCLVLSSPNLVSVDIVFYHATSNPIFSAAFERKRFSLLCQFIKFDDASVHKERWKSDKFAAFCDFFEAINERFLKLRRPSHSCAIDETLYPYRGAIGFKQYNPSKPAKFGLLWCALCDSIRQYTYISLAYEGYYLFLLIYKLLFDPLLIFFYQSPT